MQELLKSPIVLQQRAPIAHEVYQQPQFHQQCQQVEHETLQQLQLLLTVLRKVGLRPPPTGSHQRLRAIKIPPTLHQQIHRGRKYHQVDLPTNREVKRRKDPLHQVAEYAQHRSQETHRPPGAIHLVTQDQGVCDQGERGEDRGVGEAVGRIRTQEAQD